MIVFSLGIALARAGDLLMAADVVALFKKGKLHHWCCLSRWQSQRQYYGYISTLSFEYQ